MRFIGVFILAALLVCAPGAGPGAAPARLAEAEPAGSFDLATVEELALFYAVESYRRLKIPLLLRLAMIPHDGGGRKEAIEEIRANPPRADEKGVVYPFGDGNPLSFVYDPQTRTLTAWERMVKKRGTTGFMGMTGPEHAAALNAVSSRQRDRGGADWAWDPIRDAISLRRVYHHPPEDRERFYREIDRLLATQRKWAKKRYLKETIALAEARRPPESATATKEGFTATLVLRHFSAPSSESQFWVERYFRAWAERPRTQAPMLVSDRQVEVAAETWLYFFVHFQGAENDPAGAARVEATFKLVAEDSTVLFENFPATVWREPAKPPDFMQIGVNNTFVKLDTAATSGGYRLEARVCDAVAERCVDVTHPYEVRVEAP